jgi:hypothetical protein
MILPLSRPAGRTPPLLHGVNSWMRLIRCPWAMRLPQPSTDG